MLIDFNLTLNFASTNGSACALLKSRQQSIATITPSNSDIELNFKLSVPDQLTFVLSELGQQASVVLKKFSLGGLELPQSILDQICIFVPVSSNQSLITPEWWEDGKVTIDFFAGDWVQYHLLYGNKIIL